jgi:cytidylate kinase
MDVDQAVITAEIRARDLQDSSRDIAPLKRAPDACYVDSSSMTIDEVVASMLSICAEKDPQ